MKNKLILRTLLLALLFSPVSTFAANGETIFGITNGNTLVRFNSDTPLVIEDEVAITGLQVSEVASAIDFRPANNVLYLIGSTDTVYTLNPDTGAASAVGTALSFSGTKIGIDFNPVADAIRVVSNADENARVNATTGDLISNDSALAYDAGDVNTAQSPNIVAAAYTSNSVGQTVTTLFVIDSATNTLVRQGSANGTPVGPNTGTLFTIGSLGIDPSENVGFDITEARDGSGLLSAVLEGETSAKLYSIDLGGGHATLIGTIATASPVIDIAVQRAGAIRLNQTTYTVNENVGTLSVFIDRIGGSSNSFSGTEVPATVVINTNSFTATAGQDFTNLSNTVVTFAEGEVSKTVSITILDDTQDEETESFTITLSSPAGGLILSDSGTAAVYIVDNEVAPAPDTTVPLITLDVDKKIKKSRFLRQGLKFNASCNEACIVEASLIVSKGIANRFDLGSRTLDTTEKSLTANVSTQITVRPSSNTRGRLQNRSGSIPATLKVVATDASGNTSTETKKVVIQDDIRRR